MDSESTYSLAERQSVDRKTGIICARRYCAAWYFSLSQRSRLGITAVTLLVLVEFTEFHPFNTFGFSCGDPKLQFKYEGETVSTDILLCVSFVAPFFIFYLVEWLTRDHSDPRKDSLKALWLGNGHTWYLRYLHGLCLTFLTVDVIKVIAGEPRPHFFDTCKPIEAVGCSPGEYFPRFTCDPRVPQKLRFDSYKSFPSGHAAFSFYAASFLAIYFTRKVRTKSLFLLNLAHLLCVSWAMLCSISRITDHRHHWWDVLCGGILGVLICWYFFMYRHERGKNKKTDVERMKPFDSKLMTVK